MSFLAALLVLASLVALVIGLVSPRLVLPIVSPSRWKVLALYGGSFIVTSIIFGPDEVTPGDTSPEEVAAAADRRARRDSIANVLQAREDSILRHQREVQEAEAATARAINAAALRIRVLCEHQVRAQLRAPASARFGGWVHEGRDTSVVVSGHVDAQNAFGATLRTPVICGGVIRGDSIALTHAALVE